MLTLALIGLLGGLITGISPCILPVLPVVFFAGGSKTTDDEPETPPDSGGAVAVKTKEKTSKRPYAVIAGLVLSFVVFTLLGSLLINALGLPDTILRNVGVVVLILVGLGLIFPKLEELLEKPFAFLPQRQVNPNSGGFVLGLLYVPCAGPVLAAITVASATGDIGWDTVALTISFAVGAALPLLLFALAGRRVSERIGWVRRNQKTVRRVGGVVMVLLAFALFFNVTDLIQRAVPNYTQSLQEKVENNEAFQPALSGLTNKENSALSNCTTNQASELQDCGPAPEFKNIKQWFNSPGTTIAQLKGKVTLVDFWAYACVNCQRTLPHITDWDRTYRDAGLQVIGIHTPEFTFERDATNVADAIAKEKIEYPVGLDNQTSTFTQYRNRYWPARYLIDATGTVRNIKLGECEYDRTEGFIRTLLTEADPSVELPPSTTLADTTPDGAGMTPETYLGANDIEKALVGGTVENDQPKAYRFPDSVPDDKLGLTGTWAVDYEKATPAEGAGMRLNYSARTLNLVLSGQGTVTVSVNGGSAHTIPISGTPNLYTLVTQADQKRQTVDLTFTGGVQAYDFTFG